jgi:hypothetical protein
MGMKSKLIFLLATFAVWPGFTSFAEEGGGGHYLPGGASSFIDELPGRPSFVPVNYFTYYNASANASHPLPLGGLVAANLNAVVNADTLGLIYETPLRLLGGNYALGAAAPYLWMDVRGRVTLPGGGTIVRRDTANGIGDVQLFPFALGWTNGPDWKYDVRLAVYAPTGDYKSGRLANVGKNYWTFEPGASVSWLSTKIGTEATLFASFDVSTKNDQTDYQSGDVFHLDGTLAQHLPLPGGTIGAGVNGFYYQQITGDSGSGARLGDFEGRTVGVGPVISYVAKICGKTDLAIEVKWLPELDAEHRLKGDFVWVKLALVF